MGTLAYVLDEKYEELKPTLDSEREAIETLVYINHELYAMIESSVSIDLLTRLLSTQLLGAGRKASAGSQPRLFPGCCGKSSGREWNGGVRPDLTVDEIVKAFAMWERAQLYDWCLCSGDYSLVTYADKMTPLFLKSFQGRTLKFIFLFLPVFYRIFLPIFSGIKRKTAVIAERCIE